MARSNATPAGLSILLIDRRRHWRETFARALEQDGFDVRPTGRYAGLRSYPTPDLVILACTVLGAAERRLIRALSKEGQRPLVLATDLPIDDMREAFLAGALDATHLPARGADLVALVRDNLEELSTPAAPRALSLVGH